MEGGSRVSIIVVSFVSGGLNRLPEIAMAEMNRREFVTTLAAAAAGICLSCGGDVCFGADAAPAPGAGGTNKVDIGTAADYPSDGLYDKYLKDQKIIISREGDKIRALSGLCTHKGFPVTVKGKEIVCPKHGSRFDETGKNTKAPAASPLFHLGISQNADGHLIVDKAKKLGMKELEDPSSFVKLG